jgi:uncharacterized protein (DUF58 family)
VTARLGGRPVPTALALALLALGLLPAAWSLADPGSAWTALALDGAVLALCVLDFVLAPAGTALTVRRDVEPVLANDLWSPVALELRLEGRTPLRCEVRDPVPVGAEAAGNRQDVHLTPAEPSLRIEYRIRPLRRGDLRLGDLWVRIRGRLGLCARQVRLPSAATLKVYPDLAAMGREALALAAAQDAPAAHMQRRPSEGSEFESFREYRLGDDSRTLDWKATARYAKPMVRVHQPERNQSILMLLDCGRHMAGQVRAQRKLDFAVDAALRLARVCLHKGDRVGVLAFAGQVVAHLPPNKGADHLRALAAALYRIEARLEESDYGAALDAALSRHHKRSLLVLFTDCQDPDSASTLLRRTLALRPRHLPLVVSVQDEDVTRAAHAEPGAVGDAYIRRGASRLEADYHLTHARLRDAGALAVRVPATHLGAAAINAYLRVKSQGLL